MAKPKEEEIDLAGEELSDAQKEELAKESERVEAAKLAKAEEKRKAREAAEGTEASEKLYTNAQVLALIQQAVKKAVEDKVNGVQDESLDGIDPFAQKKVRLPRFLNKFIIAFKNTNTDEYFPDQVIHAFDIWNDQLKQNIPYVTLVFEDGSTPQNVPLDTVLKKSQKVWVDLVEVVKKDTSYSAGVVEQTEVKDYSRIGLGNLVKQKVTRFDYKYKVKLPATTEFPNGKEVEVGKEVVNW